MRPALLSLLLTLPLLGQGLNFGDPFAVTGMRYDMAVRGTPLVVSNGREALLFWATDYRVRATQLAQNAHRASYAVLDVVPGIGSSFDAVWTGKHFLVVASRYGMPDRIVGRLVAANGEPIGEQFTIVDGARHPRIAFNGRSAMLLYEPTPTNEVSALMLDADGRATSAPRQVGARFGAISAIASNGDTFAALFPRGPELRAVIFDRNGATRSETTIASSSAAEIASDGRRYLIVTAEESATNVHAQILEANGTAGLRLALEPPALQFFRAPSAAWTGSQWIVSYTRYPEDGEFRVVYLDPDARTVQHRERRLGNDSSIDIAGGRPVIAYLPQGIFSDVIHVDGAGVSIAPAEQILRAVASSSDATLVVWVEGGALHAAVRRDDGRWTERVISPELVYNVAAASDGREFAVLCEGSTHSFVLRLDPNGQPLGSPIPVTGFAPRDIVWSGSDYILVGEISGITIARLGPSGNMTAPVKVLTTGGLDHVLVSNGAGFYAAWITVGIRGEHEPNFPPGGVSGIRLGPDFQPLDPAPFVYVANDHVTGLAATWDGTRYVVAWAETRGVMTASVSSATPSIRLVSNEPATELAAAGGAIIWKNGSAQRFALNRLLVTIDENVSATAPARLAAFSGGRYAIVRSSHENGQPHEGASRIMMTVAAPSLPPLPDAPQATGELRGDTFTLTWTAPPQPVSGYRVEVRIGTAPWVEIEGPFAPEQRSFSGFAPAGRHAYRVRAWNEAGEGVYSPAVTVQAPRRRATR